MAAHRHWALSMLARPGSGNGVGVSEIEMRGSVGGADLCVGGTASGVSNFGHVPANAFDNNNTTIWHNAGTGGLWARLAYQFLTDVDVVEIKVRNAPATPYSGIQFGPLACRVEWSDDGTNWFIGSRCFDTSILGNDEEIVVGGISDAAPGGVFSESPFVKSENAPPWPVTVKVAVPMIGFVQNSSYGGRGRISGTVKIKGTPNYAVYRKVRLVREIDAICVAEQWSDPVTGVYQFDYYDETKKYTVISYDYENDFRAVIADNLTPDIIT